jgi:hypothetical protein
MVTKAHDTETAIVQISTAAHKAGAAWDEPQDELMDTAYLFWFKRIAIALALAWIVGVGYMQFSDVISDYGLGSASYQRGASECEGSYASRYDCKSSILIAGENQAFFSWLMKFVIVFLPPIGLGRLYAAVRRRHEAEIAQAARRRAMKRRDEAETA